MTPNALRLLAIVFTFMMSGLGSIMGAPPAKAQDGQAPSLEARYYHTAVYNESSDRMIVAGGISNDETLNDTWILSNASGKSGPARWEHVKPGGETPGGRSMAGAVFNQSSNRMILFGGEQGWLFSNEVWVLSGADGSAGQSEWTQLHPTGVPPAEREGINTVYNPGSNRLIVIGGGAYTSVRNDVWLLINADGTGGTPEWRLVRPNGTSPYLVEDSLTAYNSRTNRVIGYGAYIPADDKPYFPYNKSKDIWILENADCTAGTPTWNKVAPLGVPPEEEAHFSAVYNEYSNRMIFFSGDTGNYSSANHTPTVWVLLNADGTTGTPEWLKLSPGGPAPGPRSGTSAVFDTGGNRLIIFGGRGTIHGELFNDVWILQNADGTGGSPQWKKAGSLSVAFRKADERTSSWHEGRKEKVRWAVSGGSGPYSISLDYRMSTYESSSPWIPVATDMQNSGEYLWKVPKREKDSYRDYIEIRVTATDSSSPPQSVSVSISGYINEPYPSYDHYGADTDNIVITAMFTTMVVVVPVLVYIEWRRRKLPLEERMEHEDWDMIQLSTAEKNIKWVREHPGMEHRKKAKMKLEKAALFIKGVEEKSDCRAVRLQKAKKLLEEAAPSESIKTAPGNGKK
jgi:hypothetical protein